MGLSQELLAVIATVVSAVGSERLLGVAGVRGNSSSRRIVTGVMVVLGGRFRGLKNRRRSSVGLGS